VGVYVRGALSVRVAKLRMQRSRGFHDAEVLLGEHAVIVGRPVGRGGGAATGPRAVEHVGQ